MSESESEEKKEDEKIAVKLASTSAGPCPVIPDSVQRIMDTVDKMDKSEISELDGFADIAGILQERKRKRAEAMKKLESSEIEGTGPDDKDWKRLSEESSETP